MQSIRDELEIWRPQLEQQGKLIEAQRLHQRTMFDLEMMKEIGYCHGIENYSRHFSGRLPGEAPPTLLDYLPQDSLIFFRREPPDRAATAWHVWRRPLPQRDAGRPWISPAQRSGQPTADV